MTVASADTNVIRYTGNGSLKVFAYPFVIAATTHLEVTLDGVVQGSGWTADNVRPTIGGDVTFTTAPGSGVIVTLRRVVPMSQLADYITGGAFPADTHELALDLLTMITAQNDEALDRCVHFPVTSETISPALPDPDDTTNHGKVLRLNASGWDFAAFSSSDIIDPLSTKGDLLGYSTLAARLPAGTNDWLLVPDSAEAMGLKYVQGLTTQGDLLTRDASGYQRLAAGTVNQVLSGDGTDVEWVDQAWAQGQCKLQYTNSTTLTLLPYNGNHLIIKNGGGVWEAHQIPAAGVTAGVGELASMALFYVYASWNGSAIVLTTDATAPVIESTYGFAVMSGDETELCVGFGYSVDGLTFVDTTSQRFVRSFFNDRGALGTGSYTTDRSTTSATYAEVNSEIEIQMVVWAGERVDINFHGSAHVSSGTIACGSGFSIDSATVPQTSFPVDISTTELPITHVDVYDATLGGMYTFRHLAKTASGTLTFNGGATEGSFMTVRSSGIK
jgi:hypothetical protein